MTRNTVLFAATLALAAAGPASVSAEAGPQFRDTKSQSLGRTGVASSHGGTALFLNPAALARSQGGELGMSMDLGVNSVLVDYASWAADNYKYLNNMDSLLTKIGPVDNKWAPFSQSLMLYGNWEGVGFSVLSDTRYNLTLGKAVVTPVPGIGALSDLVLTAGRGFNAEDGYRFGFALKYIYRLRFEDRLVGTTDEEFYKVKESWEKPDAGWSDKLAKIQVAGDIAETKQGVGANLGAEKDINADWTAGLSLLDFPTVMNQRFTRPEINLGLAFHRDVDWVPDLDNKLLVNLDWQRFLIPGTPWFKQLKAGVAMEGWMKKRPVSYIGVGLNDGYPTFGVRFGYIVYLSYVYVAEEIGTYPGQEKLSFHKLVLQAEI
ncbi:MAG: hypothetical protein JWP91_3133 [Fibrobacteres bacterium]|nr:hypothetical protein [Fibrobacterota bacterium]